MKAFGTVLAGLTAAFTTMLFALPAMAQEAEKVAYNDRDKGVAIAVGLGMAIAAFGGALGQGRAAGPALEGLARNPGAREAVFVPLIISLALIESLVIYSLIISLALFTKIH